MSVGTIVRGFSIYVTEKEFRAVQECIESLSGTMESAGEDYNTLVEPIVDEAYTFEKKCLLAFYKANK